MKGEVARRKETVSVIKRVLGVRGKQESKEGVNSSVEKEGGKKERGV